MASVLDGIPVPPPATVWQAVFRTTGSGSVISRSNAARASPEKAGGEDHSLNPCATARRTRASGWLTWGRRAASARGRPVGEHVQSGTSEGVLVAVVEKMSQPEHLGTEQSAGRVRVRAQRCGSCPGRLVAPNAQQDGGSAPCRVVVLAGVCQRAVHQLLERGADPEQFLNVREDRPVAVPDGHVTKGALVDAVVLAVLDRCTGAGIPGTRTASQFGLNPRLVPAAREVPRLQEFGLGIPAPDLLPPAPPGIRPVLEEQLGDVPVVHLDRQAERVVPKIRVAVLMEKDPHQVRVSSPDRGDHSAPRLPGCSYPYPLP